MKSFLIVLAVIGSVLAGGQKYMKAKEECAKEFPVDEEAVKRLFKEGLKDDVDESIKCHIKCIMEKSEHLDENGHVKLNEEDEHKDSTHHAKINNAMDKCKDITVKNCDDAYKLKKCIWNEIKDFVEMDK